MVTFPLPRHAPGRTFWRLLLKRQMNIKYILLLSIISLLSSCILTDTNCCEKINSTKITDEIYLEKYRTFCAGVLGELTDCYLTDSLSFRMKIGSYDEHERLIVKFNQDKFYVYNTTSNMVFDTIETAKFSLDQLLKTHHTDNKIRSTKPIFGFNTITCDTDYHSGFGDYSIDENLIITKTQFRCGDKYLNAEYLTGSSNFRILIGVYEPGSLDNNYHVVKLKNDSFAFYNIAIRDLTDTIATTVFTINQLKKSELSKVCD